jgi:methylmalonyl-CoA mutase cobalamin-binding domain/chain
LMIEKGLDDKLWLIGGVIPMPDQEALRELGLDGIFPAGSRLEEIVDFINERVQ